MSTILMAVLIIAVTVLLPWIFIARHKTAQKKQAQENFRRLSNAGSERALSFSRQEVIQNKILGFDGQQQKLLIIELENEYDVTCIDVKELSQCRIDKIFQTGTDSSGTKENRLTEIRLIFSFSDNREPVYISFYTAIDSIYRMAEMEAKATEWQLAVSGLIRKTVKA